MIDPGYYDSWKEMSPPEWEEDYDDGIDYDDDDMDEDYPLDNEYDEYCMNVYETDYWTDWWNNTD